MTDTTENTNPIKEAGRVEITCFTDPLCCWSWAFEPQWRKLRYQYAGSIAWNYVMGGLLPDWQSYHDDVNSISRPVQMGPLWMQVHHFSGMPLADRLWMLDPPVSSYPACIAVKCAQLQSPAIAESYLRLLREAVMIHQQNISKTQVIVAVAEKLAAVMPEFNVETFKLNLKNEIGLEAFKADLQQVQYRNINRFPSLVIRKTGGHAVVLTGYKPFHVLEDAVLQVCPGLQKTNPDADTNSFTRYWGSALQRELDELAAIHQTTPVVV